MSILPFYREQAARETTSADAASLDNVRDRHRRAAQAWTVLADRVEHSDTLRAAREKPAAASIDADPIEIVEAD